MISKNQFIESITKEILIIRHLAAKLNDSDLNYRLTEGQRSTLEVLQYISFVLGTSIEVAITGDQDLYKNNKELSKSATRENFDALMASQQNKIKTLIEPLNEEELNEVVEVWTKAPRAIHFLSALKWAVGYKMQLFLQMKASGHKELNTMNLWLGVDPEPKV